MRTVAQVIRRQYLGAIALVALVVVVAGSASGATGDFLRLGRVNAADESTRLRTTGDGPALGLVSEAGEPSLSVSNSALVPRLNAALVGGKPASAFAKVNSAYSKAEADARFVASDAPQVLYYVVGAAELRPPRETAPIAVARVRAPAKGVLNIRVGGRCEVGGGSTVIAFLDDEGSGPSYGDDEHGDCEALHTAKVEAGQVVRIAGSLVAYPSDGATGSFSGVVEVVFQPD